MKSHEIDYRLIGDDMQAVIVTLDPQETVVAEAGAMMYMQDDITMNTSLDPTGRPYGLLAGGDYEEQQVAIREGDCLLLYTDGVVECENPFGEPFGLERLRAIVARERRSGLDGLLERLEQAVREFRAGREADDDATIVVLRFGASA